MSYQRGGPHLAFTAVRTAPTVPIAREARFGKNATMYLVAHLGRSLKWLKVKQPHYREGERGWEPKDKS
jgi:hypothetical protein